MTTDESLWAGKNKGKREERRRMGITRKEGRRERRVVVVKRAR